jgi:hypothetical protein
MKTNPSAGKSSKLKVKNYHKRITKCTQTLMPVQRENGLLIADEPVKFENEQLKLQTSEKSWNITQINKEKPEDVNM